jgi:glycine/D-amino acid oxidase-like deaminating enzyme
MSDSQTPRTLIVGAGLAGTLMAWELEKRGVSYEVWDSGAPSASKVAAGMYNPLSFKRLVEVWNATPHMEQMHKTYSELGEFLGIKALHSSPIMRIFPNQQYSDLWQRRYDSGHDVAKWITPVFSSEDAPDGVIALYGYGVVKDAGWVDVSHLISSMRSFLEKEGRFKIKSWDYSTAQNFDSVIDCRGVGAQKDLASEGMKLATDHGEVLTLKSKSLTTEGKVLNRVKWLLPIKPHTFKLGATYEWGVVESKPTEKGKSELLDAISPVLSDEISNAFTIINHESGLRPASHDRRPYVGPLRDNPGVFTFNGLGTRGVLIGPSMAKMLADHIEKGATLSPEVRPSRVLKS